MKVIIKYDMMELVFPGPAEGNPFNEVELHSDFCLKERTIPVRGFYDGDGIYKVRFMPDQEGMWTYRTRSNKGILDNHTGEFLCKGVNTELHGPVRVHNTYHFQYADGTSYYCVGTTCYAWIHQDEQLQEQTLQTLKLSPFNKLRMCIFPKRYEYNKNEPPLYPFQRNTDKTGFDFTRYNPQFFRNLEKRVEQLRDMGIEADIILFHPYDEGHWGFDRMDRDADHRYLQYVVARLAAYCNVWWSLANEFSFMKDKSEEAWDGFFQLIQAEDPYQHLRSIHNGPEWYDHTKSWVTHLSGALGNTIAGIRLRKQYNKPIVFDEFGYEGDVKEPWGNMPPQAFLEQFWLAAATGCYGGHGETYWSEDEVLWWSKGGVLRGHTPSRLKFLRDIMEDAPADGLVPFDDEMWGNSDAISEGDEGRYHLVYFGQRQPREWVFRLNDGYAYQAEIIDPWEMTITPVTGEFKGNFTVPLPSKPNLAIRLRAV